MSICSGCYCCQISYKDEHVANDWTPYAKPQPDTGQFWIGLREKVRGHIPHVKVSYTPFICNHCDDAPCIEQCKAEAINEREDGLVIINSEKCIGCTHLLDNDEEWTVPRCVDQCPTEALKFGEENDFDRGLGDILMDMPGK